MRPNIFGGGTELYECFDCGRRTETAETPSCSSCGGELRNLTRSRDL
ncbi:rubrerythrin-like domain-containing protein [Natronomonas gomsonensis]|nr:rubrerythrin-like domain-containing protein [Natronomonas gomsonensis]MCY4731128.1 rubrerythrin-like domain-containing protein [Natronomonas gomsonensis]